MTSPSAPDGAGRDGSSETERIPAADSSGHSPSSGEPASSGQSPPEGRPDADRSAAQRAQAISVLDQPLDDKDLGEQIRRPGLSRSTRWLLLLLGAVVVFALGTFLGRATAPDTGPGSSPDVVGTVESVAPGGAGTSQITVRTGDNKLVVLSSTAGTPVAVPRPTGVAGLRPGEQVIVGAQVNKVGGLDATHVDLAASR